MKIQNIHYEVSVNRNILQTQQNFSYENYQNAQKENVHFGKGFNFGFSWRKIWDFIKEVFLEELERRGMADVAKKIKDSAAKKAKAAAKAKKVKNVPQQTPEEKAQRAAIKQQRRAVAKSRQQEKNVQKSRRQEEKQKAKTTAKAERLAAERQKQIEECRLSEAKQDLRVAKINQKQVGAKIRVEKAKQEHKKIVAEGIQSFAELQKQKKIRESFDKLSEFNESIRLLLGSNPKPKKALVQMSLLRDFKEERCPDMPKGKFLKYITGKKGFKSFRKFVEGRMTSLMELLPEKPQKEQVKILNQTKRNMLKATQEKNKRQREINLACAKLKEFEKYIDDDVKVQYEKVSFLKDFKAAKYKDMSEEEFIKYLRTPEGFNDFNEFFSEILERFKRVLPKQVQDKLGLE